MLLLYIATALSLIAVGVHSTQNIDGLRADCKARSGNQAACIAEKSASSGIAVCKWFFYDQGAWSGSCAANPAYIEEILAPPSPSPTPNPSPPSNPSGADSPQQSGADNLSGGDPCSEDWMLLLEDCDYVPEMFMTLAEVEAQCIADDDHEENCHDMTAPGGHLKGYGIEAGEPLCDWNNSTGTCSLRKEVRAYYGNSGAATVPIFAGVAIATIAAFF